VFANRLVSGLIEQFGWLPASCNSGEMSIAAFGSRCLTLGPDEASTAATALTGPLVTVWHQRVGPFPAPEQVGRLYISDNDYMVR
jgi:hypothetical protein